MLWKRDLVIGRRPVLVCERRLWYSDWRTVGSSRPGDAGRVALATKDTCGPEDEDGGCCESALSLERALFCPVDDLADVVAVAIEEDDEDEVDDNRDGWRPSVVPRKELPALRMFSFPPAYITPRRDGETRGCVKRSRGLLSHR